MEIILLKSKFLRNLFDQNTYVLKNGGNAIIVDAGAELEDVKNTLQGAKVQAVLMTHLHFDHIWNIEQYLNEFDCKVYICKGAEEKFSDPEKNASSIMRNKFVRNVPKEKIAFYDGDKLEIGEFEVGVFYTPGHSADCVCLKVDNALFSGDTLFAGGIGRTDLYDSDNEAMRKSLKQIREIDFDVYYSGHGEPADKSQAKKVIDYCL